MVIKSALQECVRLLKSVSDVPLLEARILLETATGLDRLSLIKNGSCEISPVEAERYMRLANERLSGKPIAYITGHKEFMGLDFLVNENVLIPRPDTETLVECAINAGKRKILDIGTGSGAIAVSLAKFLPDSKVFAVDISPEALKIAEKNADDNNVDVSFSLLDILNDNIESTFDLIVSNPPYIRDSVILSLDKTVRDFEPRLALSGGEDGLIFYRTIAKKAFGSLNGGGFLMFEIGFDQGQDVSEIMSDNYTNIRIVKDLAGCDRVVIGEKK